MVRAFPKDSFYHSVVKISRPHAPIVEPLSRGTHSRAQGERSALESTITRSVAVRGMKTS